jgi:hypothetical protein
MVVHGSFQTSSNRVPRDDGMSRMAQCIISCVYAPNKRMTGPLYSNRVK